MIGDMTTEARIAAAKGIDPCPMCGSADVRWRRRRWFDVARTWLGSLAEHALHFVLSKSTTRATIPGARSSAPSYFPDPKTERMIDNANRVAHYGKSRELYESELSFVTAARFWRCRTCKREGHMFADPEGMLDFRESLVEMEDEIAAEWGAAHNPIDRDGLPNR
jgi:hypothetical protein